MLDDKTEVAAAIAILFDEFPGRDDDRAFLLEAANNIESGNDPELSGHPARSQIVAELRRRAMRLR